LEFYIGIRTS